MTADRVKQSKKVSFNDENLTVVHQVDCSLEAWEVQDLFYQNDDCERFRYESNVAIERSTRKQLKEFRRATRRSSIDLAPPRNPPPPTPSRRRPRAPRTRKPIRRSKASLDLTDAGVEAPAARPIANAGIALAA